MNITNNSFIDDIIYNHLHRNYMKNIKTELTQYLFSKYLKINYDVLVSYYDYDIDIKDLLLLFKYYLDIKKYHIHELEDVGCNVVSYKSDDDDGHFDDDNYIKIPNTTFIVFNE